ncbi:MAG: DUF1043 family protein [Gammaproteobacteria bacterium]|nr:DUF1043 family protein [Gammaproteobacteria bacterium]
MSDAASWMWSAGFIGLALGLGAGFLLAYWVLLRNKRATELEAKLQRQRADFEAYRTRVDEHFLKTSELFQDMTERYRAVYEHLAAGAHSLCTDRVTTHRLTVPESRPLVEDRSGAPSAGSSDRPAAQPETRPATEGEDTAEAARAQAPRREPPSSAPDRAEGADASAEGSEPPPPPERGEEKGEPSAEGEATEREPPAPRLH